MYILSNKDRTHIHQVLSFDFQLFWFSTVDDVVRFGRKNSKNKRENHKDGGVNMKDQEEEE